jgi:hypothetical protein
MVFDEEGFPLNYSCINNNRRCGRVCKESQCRYNMSNEKYLNCSLIASEDGPLTLQEIGDCFGLSRMRICQIEKGIFKKIRKSFLTSEDEA